MAFFSLSLMSPRTLRTSTFAFDTGGRHCLSFSFFFPCFHKQIIGCSICCSPFFAVYEDILTPPLPLPYKGGECLRISICRGKRKPLPSLVGEGQGWGWYLYFTFVKVHQIEHPISISTILYNLAQSYKKYTIAPNNNSINWRNLDFFVRLRRLITWSSPYDFNLKGRKGGESLRTILQ